MQLVTAGPGGETDRLRLQDYDRNRLWLFGTPADRCHGNCGACTGPSCPGKPSCTSIQAWWTSLPIPTTFDTAVAIPAGTPELTHTYNQGVARVRVPGPGMPAHGYVMISEPFNFFINDGAHTRSSPSPPPFFFIVDHDLRSAAAADPDGNLTAAGAGWKLAPGQTAPKAAGGGVSMQWAADPTNPTAKPGYYYSVTGGSTVGFARSRDLKTWEPYHIVMSQQAGEYQIAPYNGFAASAARKGWAEMATVANWPKWGCKLAAIFLLAISLDPRVDLNLRPSLQTTTTMATFAARTSPRRRRLGTAPRRMAGWCGVPARRGRRAGWPTARRTRSGGSTT